MDTNRMFTLREVAAHGSITAAAEALGYDGIGVTETVGNPFLAATQAIGATESARVSTAIALAFPRTPTERNHA